MLSRWRIDSPIVRLGSHALPGTDGAILIGQFLITSHIRPRTYQLNNSNYYFIDTRSSWKSRSQKSPIVAMETLVRSRRKRLRSSLMRSTRLLELQPRGTSGRLSMVSTDISDGLQKGATVCDDPYWPLLLMPGGRQALTECRLARRAA